MTLPAHLALAAMLPRSPAWDQARLDARPYAEAIVAARPMPSRFNSADIEHAIGLEVSAIARTAIVEKLSVEAVVRRLFPEIFATLELEAAE